MPQPEPKTRERGLDTMPVDWDARIAAAVSAEHEHMMQIICAALSEALAVQREAFEVELKAKLMEIKQGLIAQLERTLAMVINVQEEKSKSTGANVPVEPLLEGKRKIN
jgi:hypothetical protein